MFDEFNNEMSEQQVRNDINDAHYNALLGSIDRLSTKLDINTKTTEDVKTALLGNKEFQIVGLIETVIMLERRVLELNRQEDENGRQIKTLRRDAYIIAAVTGFLVSIFWKVITFFKP